MIQVQQSSQVRDQEEPDVCAIGEAEPIAWESLARRGSGNLPHFFMFFYACLV
jgi:hypothetical protein